MSEQWIGDGEYPVRCRIEDVAGQEVSPGFIADTPQVSKPYVGAEGNAELMPDGFNVKITLDDGAVLYGYQCWWRALPPLKEAV
jgi:hypothetical protein